MFVFLLFFFLSFVFSSRDISDIPLNQWPMVMSHDAATGYLKMNVLNAEVYKWTITQTANASGQLDCGTRAFDWRPAVNKGKLVMHHGFDLFHLCA
jgi:hypothetical protein